MQAVDPCDRDDGSWVTAYVLPLVAILAGVILFIVVGHLALEDIRAQRAARASQIAHVSDSHHPDDTDPRHTALGK